MKYVQDKTEKFNGRYTQQYILGVIVIGLIALLCSNIISSQHAFGTVMNLSGRQTMLSQQAAFYVNALIHSTASDRPEIRQRLKKTIESISVSHQDLSQGNIEKNIPKISSEAIHDIYFSKPFALDQTLQNYLRQLATLANASDEILNQKNLALEGKHYENTQTVLQLFEHLLDQYQLEHDSSFIEINKHELFALVILFISLLAVGLGIFMPMINTVKSGRVALKDREIRLSTLMDNALDTMISFSDHGKILSINKAGEALFGYASKELMGENVLKLIPVEQKLEHLEYLKNYRSTGQTDISGDVHELGGLRKDGSIFPADIVINEVILSDHEQIFFGVIRDISARKNTEADLDKTLNDLRSVNGELERFTYTVSHDLKSPLVTINGFIGILEEDIQTNNTKGISASIQFIKSATKTMQALLNDLLELSKVGFKQGERSELSFNDLIPDVLLSLTEQIKIKGATIDIEDNLPLVTIEKIRFTEVFLNLIENSLKYMDGQVSPHISIGVESRPNSTGIPETIFFVKDNGRGLKPEYCHKVFEIFERVAVDVEGTGVGLAIVKRIIEIHDGHIWVESDGLGKGTTFFFSLPVIPV